MQPPMVPRSLMPHMQTQLVSEGGLTSFSRPKTVSTRTGRRSLWSFQESTLTMVPPLLLGISAANRQRRRRAVCCRAQGDKIETFLVPGPVTMSKLAQSCGRLASHIDLAAVAFFALGVKPELIASVAGGALGLHGMCPVYVADCYGIIGWDAKLCSNVELMEKGIGQEYGCVGGNGGEGVVVVSFRGSGHVAAAGALPDSRPVSMLVLGAGCQVPQSAASRSTVFGGYAKACFKLEHSGDLVAVDSFSVSSPAAVVSSFNGDAQEAAAATAGAMRPGLKAVAAAYFPCFCRGFNLYKRDNVESAAFAAALGPEARLFGMFAHGELGPPLGTAVCAEASEPLAMQQHSETSVLAVYLS